MGSWTMNNDNVHPNGSERGGPNDQSYTTMARPNEEDGHLRTDGGSDQGNEGPRPLAQIKMNRRRVDIGNPKPTVKELLKATNRTPPENFDVFRLENEGDKEGTKIPLTTIIDRTSEQSTVFLRAVENDRNAGR